MGCVASQPETTPCSNTPKPIDLTNINLAGYVRRRLLCSGLCMISSVLFACLQLFDWLVIYLRAVSQCDECSLSQAQIDEIEMGAFFSAMKRVDTSRDYTIIVDASGSMWSPGSVAGKSRWDEARAAVAFLAPHVVQCDPDGLSLYFFGSSFKKYDNVTSAERVNQLFSQTNSLGCTDLAAVLADAVAPDSAGRPETSTGRELVYVGEEGEVKIIVMLTSLSLCGGC
jgi:hypothetical protein